MSLDAPASASDASTVMSVAPLNLVVEGRGMDLQIRVSFPAGGTALPIILFSHGNGQSLYAYGPLANYWAANGFLVIQPTHLDSRMIGLDGDDPRRAQLWRSRENDLTEILDQLDMIEAAVATLTGRLDRGRIAVAGHSWGAQTASMLLGATHPNPEDGSVVSIADARIKAGVLLAVPGTGGPNLSPFAAEHFAFMNPDFSGMTTPTLIIAGDNDRGAMTVRGPDWWREAYDFSPAPKALFTVSGGEHSLGGIPNYEAKETTDERPERVAAIQRLTTAYLRSALDHANNDWKIVSAELTGTRRSEGQIEVK